MGVKSILKKIGKVATIAAPIIAAPFTGGASLAAIGAASGAGNALLNGSGVKGAALGAGLGAGGALAAKAAMPGAGGQASKMAQSLNGAIQATNKLTAGGGPESLPFGLPADVVSQLPGAAAKPSMADLGSLIAKLGGAGGGTTSKASSGGLNFKQMLGLTGAGAGLDILGSVLGGGDPNARSSFQGMTAANGQSLNPGDAYGEGLAALKGLMPSVSARALNAPDFSALEVPAVAGLTGSVKRKGPASPQSGGIEDALQSFKMLGYK